MTFHENLSRMCHLIMLTDLTKGNFEEGGVYTCDKAKTLGT